MGLFSLLQRAALIEAGAARAAKEIKNHRPSGFTQSMWDQVGGDMAEQNDMLAKLLRKPDVTANWEWGGYTHPAMNASRLFTDSNQHSVDIPMAENLLDKKSFFTHSHPSSIINSADELQPNPLSSADLKATTAGIRGITSLDNQGGFGFAITNPRSPLERGDLANIHTAASNAASPHLGLEEDNVLSYAPNTGTGLGGFGSKKQVVGSVALGRAMKNSGLFEHYDYTPGGPTQAASLAKLEPAIKAASERAEEMIVDMLKARGMSAKDIAGIIVSMGGGAGILAAMRQNQTAGKPA